MNTEEPAGYTSLQKILHWGVVALLLLQYLFFDGMGRPFRQVMENGVATYSTTVIVHILIGALVLLLALWRIALRLRHGAPPPPEAEPAFAKLAAKLTHGALYLVLLALPVSGSLAWFLKIGPLAGLHEAGTNILLGLVFLHVAAVLVHQFWWKTRILARMM